jgi:outer membrane protein assembly factor BamB
MMFFIRSFALVLAMASVATATAAVPAKAVEPVVVRELAPVESLSTAGIAVVWQEKLPLKVGETASSLDALGGNLYVLTSTNYMFALGGSDGTQLFADAIAAHGLELLPLTERGKAIMVMTGSSLRKLDKTNGKEMDRLTVPFGVVAVPAANDNFYYLAADDGKIHAYSVADRVELFKAAADRGSLITNVVASNAFVIFTTNKGEIVSMQPDVPAQKWRYDASGAIKGRISLDAMDAYISSVDTNVYKFDARTGTILWNYMAGAALDEGPQVTASAVYQYAGGNGVYALDKKTGKVLWQAKDGRGLLTEVGGKAYLISRSQSLIVVDNATGKRLFEVSMPGADRYAANVADGLIYVGSAATGRIACLKPKN